MHLAHYLTYYGERWFKGQVFTGMEYKSIRIAITNHFRGLLAQLSDQVAKNGPLTPEQVAAYERGYLQATEALEGCPIICANTILKYAT